MTLPDGNGQVLQDVIIAVTFIGGLILYTRNRIPQQNVKQLTELTSTYEKRIQALEADAKGYHETIIENAKAIADLQGQIKVYKELPLRELADGIAKISDSNDEILTTLKAQVAPLLIAADKVSRPTTDTVTVDTVTVSKSKR